MKKRWALMLALFLLLSIGINGYGQDTSTSETVKDMKVAVDATRTISLQGKLPTPAERTLIVTLRDESKQLRYTNGIQSDKSGAFSLKFAPGDCPSGNYTLCISGEEIGLPISTTFYLPAAVRLYDMNVKIGEKQLLSVSGKVSSGTGRKLFFLVLDPNNVPIYVDNTRSKRDSSFQFQFPTADLATGEYSLRIGCEGSDKAFHTSFSLGSISNNACLSDIELENGSLNQPFDPYQNEYYLLVPDGVNSVQMRPIAEDLNAQVTVQGQRLSFQTTSAEVQLVGQMTNVQIHVTAQDGKEDNTYRVRICKGQPVNISEVSAFETDGLVQVNGKTDSLIEGNRIYVIVTNPLGKCDYINSTTSKADGSFSFSYKMRSKPAGAYLVRVEGELSPESTETSFVYVPPASEMVADKERHEGGGGPTLYSITIGDIEMLNTLILSAASAPSGATITLSVKDPHHASSYEIDTGSGYHVINGNTFVMPAANVKVKVHLAD